MMVHKHITLPDFIEYIKYMVSKANDQDKMLKKFKSNSLLENETQCTLKGKK